MDIQQAYSIWSASYDQDRNLTRDLDELLMQEIFGNVRFESILELGCGTGKNTLLLSRIGNSVEALDFSAEMVAKAKARAAFENVVFKLADLTRAWPCDSEIFEMITCNLVLEHIEDLGFVFAEARRVLRNRGRFFVSELHPYRQYQGSKATYRVHDASETIQAFVHHVTDFTDAAHAHGLALESIKEWWHEEDKAKPPRLISFMFRKS
jgi:malonyl-CoA O-methyltransferase